MPNRVGSLFLLLIVLVAVLVAATTGSAWHEEDGAEYDDSRYVGGDPRIPEDARGCLEQTKDHDGIDCTVQYVHLGDVGKNDVTNLQRPAECAPTVSALGMLPVAMDPVWWPPGRSAYPESGLLHYMHSSNDEPCFAGESRFPNTLGDDVVLNKDINITVHWTLSSDWTPSQVDLAVGTMPCLTVKTVLNVGTTLEPIASGETTKTIVSLPATGSHSTGIEDPCPGSTGELRAGSLTPFEIDLGPAKRDIPADGAFRVHTTWYQWDGSDVGQDNPVVQNQWRLHNPDENPSRVVLPVENALESPVIEPRYFDDELYIRASFKSPWGHYDLDSRNVRVQVFDSSGDEVPVKYIEDFYMYSNHDRFAPRNITFPWDYQKEDLESGTYTIRVTGANWQHTAEATNEATLHLESGEPQVVKSPMPPPLVIPVALAFGVIMLRRKA